MILFFKSFFGGFWSLIAGMIVTLRYAFKKPVTFLYPRQSEVTPYFRGPIAFTEDPADPSPLCIACMACVKACPSRCIELAVDKNTAGQRVLKSYQIDASLCSLCATCIEVCPTDALKHDVPGYDEVASSRSELVHDLLGPFRKRGVDLNRPILTPAQRKAAAAAAAAATAASAPKGPAC